MLKSRSGSSAAAPAQRAEHLPWHRTAHGREGMIRMPARVATASDLALLVSEEFLEILKRDTSRRCEAAAGAAPWLSQSHSRSLAGTLTQPLSIPNVVHASRRVVPETPGHDFSHQVRPSGGRAVCRDSIRRAVVVNQLLWSGLLLFTQIGSTRRRRASRAFVKSPLRVRANSCRGNCWCRRSTPDPDERGARRALLQDVVLTEELDGLLLVRWRPACSPRTGRTGTRGRSARQNRGRRDRGQVAEIPVASGPPKRCVTRKALSYRGSRSVVGSVPT